MGLLKLIEKTRLGLKGLTPPVTPGSLSSSTLHKTTSLNGIPNLPNSVPSRLDLDGKLPGQYIDNLPG